MVIQEVNICFPILTEDLQKKFVAVRRETISIEKLMFTS